MCKTQRHNALVICNHGPPVPGNSGDFDFWSSKSPLKAPPCWDCLLVKPLLFSPTSAIFSFHGPFCLIKQTPGISEAMLWQNFGQSPTHFHGYLKPSHGGGGLWLQMTSAHVHIAFDITLLCSKFCLHTCIFQKICYERFLMYFFHEPF